MKYFYSIKNKAFYGEDCLEAFGKENLLPDDLKEISAENYTNFFNTPEGYYSVFDDNGPRIQKIPEPDYPALAQVEKKDLMDKATAAITIWQTKLLMGRKLTTDETSGLNKWMDYIDNLNELDLSSAPDISWPALPE